MFIISQYILNISGICTEPQQVPLYSIALGLVLYSSLYLYILFYNNDYLGVFNTFVIYVIIGDILLSAFYYFNQQNTRSFKSLEQHENTEYTDNEHNEDNEDDMESVESVESVESIESLDNVDGVYSEEESLEEGVDEISQNFINNLIEQAKEYDKERNIKLEITNEDIIPLLVNNSRLETIEESNEDNIEPVEELIEDKKVEENNKSEEVLELLHEEKNTKKKNTKKNTKKKVEQLVI